MAHTVLGLAQFAKLMLASFHKRKIGKNLNFSFEKGTRKGKQDKLILKGHKLDLGHHVQHV